MKIPYAPLQREQDPAYRMQVRHQLVDKLVRFGAHQMGVTYAPLQHGDRQVAEAFLAQLTEVGRHLPPFRRANGEWV